MEPGARVELEALMRHQGRVRALARSLVGDAHAADDVSQDAWVRALERGPRDARNLSGWFGAVVRSLAHQRWRSERRREAREALAARPESGEDELVERLESFELVVAAVRALEEPYRTAILLRYFEDLSPTGIAARQGVPLGTVETRLHRGLELLRRRLDRRPGGRAAWLASLVPLALPSQPIVVGSLLMKTQVKVAVAVALCALVGWIAYVAVKQPSEAGGAPLGGQSALAAPDVAPTAAQDARAPSEALSEEARRAAALEPATPATPPDVVVRGVVVDTRRMPVEGAQVELALGERAALRTTSRADGTFEFALQERPRDSERGQVWARLGGDRAGFRTASITGSAVDRSRRWMSPPEELAREVDVGRIPLLPASAITVFVLQDGKPVEGAALTADFGAELPGAARAVTTLDGSAVLPSFPAGRLRVHAERGESGATAAVFLPDESRVTIDLLPKAAVDLVAVDKDTGDPVPGASIEIEELLAVSAGDDPDSAMLRGTYYTRMPLPARACTTDAQGRAHLDLPAGRDLRLRVQAEGYRNYPDESWGSVPITAQTRIELEPRAGGTVRWPVVPGEVDVPPEGTVLSLRWMPGASREAEEPKQKGVVQGGFVVVDGLGSLAYFLAAAPDGALAFLRSGKIPGEGPEVSFRRPRKIDVLVRDADGAPVHGALACARNQGNNPLCEWRETDAQGRATLTGMYGGLAEVYVNPPGQRGGGEAYGSVDLDRGDGQVEVTLPRQCVVRLRTTIAGLPALPTKFSLYCAGGARVLEELPERGELRVRVPEASASAPNVLYLRSMGYLPATVEVVPVPGDEPLTEIALRRSRTLAVQVSMPKRDRVDITLDRWNDAKGGWPADEQAYASLSQPNGPGNCFLFGELEAGRYRARDRVSGVVSGVVELTEDASTAQVGLDLASVQWVTGRVDAPEGTNLNSVRILVDGLDAEPRLASWMPASELPEGEYAREGGAFKVRVPADREVTLRPWHPWLSPAKEHGTVTLRGGREGVVLTLAAGDEVRMPVPQLAGESPAKSIRVAAWRGPRSGEPERWIYAPVENGEARFAGLEPGKWTLWIDPTRDFAPLVLADVEVAAGITQLPEAAFASGSSLRIRVRVKPGEAVPRIYAFARSTAAASCNRATNSDGEAEVVLSGLEAGSYELRLGTVMQDEAPLPRSIEVDGHADLELELDLR